MSQNLKSPNFDEKRLLLDALEVKIVFYHDHNEVKGLYHSTALSRLALSIFILLLDRETQLRTPIAVITASFSLSSSGRFSTRLFNASIDS